MTRRLQRLGERANVPAFKPRQRILITGANGTGKTTFARSLSKARPDAELIHYDALKLTTDWVQRPDDEITAALAKAITGPKWILEGGPTMLAQALPPADLVIWLDLPLTVRAFRLFLRPLRGLGQTRPELPSGNRDRLGQQLRFGWRSLRRTTEFRLSIARALAQRGDTYLVHCKTPRSANALLAVLTQDQQVTAGQKLQSKAL